MSDQPPAVDQTKIQWKNATSKKGVPFQIGTMKKSTAVGATSNNGVNVNWPLTPPGIWVPTPELVDPVAISGYALVESDTVLSIYAYTLNFQNVGITHYDYCFTDGTGDSYQCNTYEDGFHYINYNSDNPTIVSISVNP